MAVTSIPDSKADLKASLPILSKPLMPTLSGRSGPNCMRSSSSGSATGTGVGSSGVGQNFVCKSGVFSLGGVGDFGGGGVGSLGGVGTLEIKTKFVFFLVLGVSTGCGGSSLALGRD